MELEFFEEHEALMQGHGQRTSSHAQPSLGPAGRLRSGGAGGDVKYVSPRARSAMFLTVAVLLVVAGTAVATVLLHTNTTPPRDTPDPAAELIPSTSGGGDGGGGAAAVCGDVKGPYGLSPSPFLDPPSPVPGRPRT